MGRLTHTAKYAVFLDGPIGAGKSTLGRALAQRLSAGFGDGDHFSDPDQPWYCSSLQTSRAILKAGLACLDATSGVVVAYPLRCVNWIYFRRRLAETGACSLFVGLCASYEAIVDNKRGRDFNAQERDRIRIMIEEGYGGRPFVDVLIDTGQDDFATTICRLETEIRRRC